MITVPDASVLVAALVDAGPEGRWARSVLARGTLAGPELLFAEATNVLRRLEQAGQVPVQGEVCRNSRRPSHSGMPCV